VLLFTKRILSIKYILNMNLVSTFKSLCLPSKVYFVLAVVGVLLTVIFPSIFGNVSVFMQLLHLVYIVFWTWVLQLICRAGYKFISWVLVLAPFVLMFIVVALTLSGSTIVSPPVQPNSPIVVLSST
jgi:hypothetical protein